MEKERGARMFKSTILGASLLLTSCASMNSFVHVGDSLGPLNPLILAESTLVLANAFDQAAGCPFHVAVALGEDIESNASPGCEMDKLIK